MLKITALFLSFLLCAPGRIRVAKWQELRKACLERAYEGMTKKGAEA